MDHKIIQQIKNHAGAEFPNECCGLICEIGGIYQYIPAKNTADNPTKHFAIDPLFYAQHVHFVKYIVHSHCNASARPSDADKANAEKANKPFLIMGYPQHDTYIYYPTGFQLPLNDREFIYQIQDCLTYVSDYYKQHYQIDLPDVHRLHYGWWDDIAYKDKSIHGLIEMGFNIVDSNTLQPGDLLLMKFGGVVASHVAVFTKDNLIAHHHPQNRGGEEQYGSYWRKNTEYVLRHNKFL